MDYVNEILELVKGRDGRISPKGNQKLRKQNPELYNWLMSQTHFLDPTAKLAHRLYCVINRILETPTCVVCGRETKYQPSKGRYARTCSVKCATRNPETKQKRNATNIDRYNNGTPANTSPKTKQTMGKKYGVSKPLQHIRFLQKRKETILRKYGESNTNKIPEITEKTKQTCLLKYGVRYAAQRNMTPAVVKNLQSREWLYEQHVVKKKSCVQIATELNVGVTTVTNAVNRFDLLSTSNRSSHEHDLAKFLASVGIRFITNDRSLIKPKEIDIFCEQEKVGIEICGHYWHSEMHGSKPKTYHLEKLMSCSKQGVRLIQIFEYEWVCKQAIVLRRLLHLFHKNKERVFARNCQVRQIDSLMSNNFLEKYHIQGHCASSTSYGLFNGGQLVGVATFGKSRFNRNVQKELLRLAFSVRVVGGASKLFNYFMLTEKPQSVISYSDKRWNTGEVYQRLGFKYSHTSKPNYWYFKVNQSTTLFNRIDFQKHKLPFALERFDPMLTEWENMLANGYDRVWDCGNDVWILNT